MQWMDLSTGNRHRPRHHVACARNPGNARQRDARLAPLSEQLLTALQDAYTHVPLRASSATLAIQAVAQILLGKVPVRCVAVRSLVGRPHDPTRPGGPYHSAFELDRHGILVVFVFHRRLLFPCPADKIYSNLAPACRFLGCSIHAT